MKGGRLGSEGVRGGEESEERGREKGRGGRNGVLWERGREGGRLRGRERSRDEGWEGGGGGEQWGANRGRMGKRVNK